VGIPRSIGKPCARRAGETVHGFRGAGFLDGSSFRPAVALVLIAFDEVEIAEHGSDAVRFLHFLRKIVAHGVKIAGDNILCLSDKFRRGDSGSMSSFPPSRDGSLFPEMAGTACW